MDGILITAAVILSVIALIEVVTFFFSIPVKGAPAYVSVLPVFRGDKDFRDRLEYISRKSCGRTRIILVGYSADEEQEMLCRQFVRDEPDAVYISGDELEKFFEEIFSQGIN